MMANNAVDCGEVMCGSIVSVVGWRGGGGLYGGVVKRKKMMMYVVMGDVDSDGRCR